MNIRCYCTWSPRIEHIEAIRNKSFILMTYSGSAWSYAARVSSHMRRGVRSHIDSWIVDSLKPSWANKLTTILGTGYWAPFCNTRLQGLAAVLFIERSAEVALLHNTHLCRIHDNNVKHMLIKCQLTCKLSFHFYPSPLGSNALYSLPCHIGYIIRRWHRTFKVGHFIFKA